MTIEPYNAKEFFESWYRLGLADNLPPERLSIGPFVPEERAAEYYQSIGNSINLLLFGKTPLLAVLDVGSGSGTWINFYKPRFVVATELTNSMVDWLRKAHPHMRVYQWDITTPPPSFKDHRFDVVNAIGVFYHIVEDDKFEAAVKNVASLLWPGGVLIVNDAFTQPSANVQYHAQDELQTWEDLGDFKKSGKTLINKRHRSIVDWTSAADKAGLELKRTIIPPPKKDLPAIQVAAWEKL